LTPVFAPESLDIAALPSLPLLDRSKLPSVAACYLVIEKDAVIYVGQTCRLQKRWNAHHKLEELKRRNADVKIAWIECNDSSLLTPIENALINWFQPELNGLELHPNSLANLTYREGRPTIFGTKKKQRTITVTEEGWEGARQAAEAAGFTSISEFLEKWGRGEVRVSA
jgi:hypothetical protein